MTPKVSIIIPIYGVEMYIEQCIHSLFKQTFEEIEFIFVNDCTKDNSIAILHRVLKQYPNRRKNTVIINKKINEGLPQARFTGLKEAKGEYIIHIDSDDWIELNMIEELYKAAHSKHLDVIWCDYYKNYKQNQNYINTKLNNTSKIYILKSLLNGNLHGAVWNKLVKKSIYNEVFFPTANMREDLVITIQVIIKSFKIGYLNQALHHYRYNDQSLTIAQNQIFLKINESFENAVLIINLLKKHFKNHINILEPELSNFVNEIKYLTVINKQCRDKDKLHNFYAESNLRIYKKNSKISLLRKTLLFFAVHNFWYVFRFTDFLKEIKQKR